MVGATGGSGLVGLAVVGVPAQADINPMLTQATAK